MGAKVELYCDMMVPITKAKEPDRVEFKEAGGIFVAFTDADQKRSMSLLQQNGLRPLTYQEALAWINQNPEFMNQLKGKWFYLDGKGLQLSGYYTFNDKGELIQGKGDIGKTVYVCNGSQQLSLNVHTDEGAHWDGWRFVLGADFGPQGVASVVAGVRADSEVAAPKIEIVKAEKPEGITLSGTSLDDFKALRRGAEAGAI